MDDHLRTIAEQHLEIRAVKINVENAPFLVTKLNVKILPCVIAFLDGVSVDRVIGFEGLGYEQDTFQTEDLERRLIQAGVLERVGGIGNLGAGKRTIDEDNRPRLKEGGDDGDEWD